MAFTYRDMYIFSVFFIMAGWIAEIYLLRLYMLSLHSMFEKLQTGDAFHAVLFLYCCVTDRI